MPVTRRPAVPFPPRGCTPVSLPHSKVSSSGEVVAAPHVLVGKGPGVALLFPFLVPIWRRQLLTPPSSFPCTPALPLFAKARQSLCPVHSKAHDPRPSPASRPPLPAPAPHFPPHFSLLVQPTQARLPPTATQPAPTAAAQRAPPPAEGADHSGWAAPAAPQPRDRRLEPCSEGRQAS